MTPTRITIDMEIDSTQTIVTTINDDIVWTDIFKNSFLPSMRAATYNIPEEAADIMIGAWKDYVYSELIGE